MCTLIGDIHGNTEMYLNIVAKHERTIQLGDLGFNYEFLNAVDSTKHRVIAGNHDNYWQMDSYPHFLGDFGELMLEGLPKIFFCRGGRSIDKESRTLGINYFPEEEFDLRQCNDAIDAYNGCEVMLSHECPTVVMEQILASKKDDRNIDPSVTSHLLQRMFDLHRPNLWVFGHHHKSFTQVIDGCKFVCLNEFETARIQDLYQH